MNREKVLITGCGITTAICSDTNSFFKSLVEPGFPKTGESGMCSVGVEQNIAGIRGIKFVDRCTKLVISSVREILHNDEPLSIDKTISLAIGSCFATSKTIIDFFSKYVNEGIKKVNPIDYPNTVYNAPASRTCLINGYTNLCSTITNGYTSSLDAIEFGCQNIINKNYKRVIVGGVEELSSQVSQAMNKMRISHGQNDSTLKPIGEGCALVLIEDAENAKKRGAKALAEIVNYNTRFCPNPVPDSGDLTKIMKASILQCLEESNVPFSDVSLIFSGANDWGIYEWAEKKAIEEISVQFQDFKPCVVSLLEKCGNCLGANGAISLIAAIGALTNNDVFSSLYYSSSVHGNVSVYDKPKYIMINTYGCGNFATILIKGT